MFRKLNILLEREAADAGLPLKKVLWFGLFLHLLTAYFSLSYHNADEHFQVLEFANYKMGNSPSEDLPWEFHEQTRQTVQPFLAMHLFQCLGWLGIRNPFTWNLILQLMTLAAAWCVTLAVCFSASPGLKTLTGKRMLWVGSFFLWFMPYLHLRFTSENVSGLFFTIAVLILLNIPKKGKTIFHFLAMGALLAFSFFFRFQMGFAIFGLLAWLLFVRKAYWTSFLYLFLSALAVSAICISIDFWFYESRVFSPYAYFQAQIIEDKVSHFGVYPWYYYFLHFLVGVIPPLSLALLPLFFFGLIKDRKSIWVWSFIPFFIAHILIGHKELRFFYPFLYMFPVVLAIAWENQHLRISKSLFWKGLYKVLIVQNIFVLLFMATPLLHRIVDFNEYYMKFLYNYTNQKKAPVTLVAINEKPYEILKLEMNFYKHPNVKLQNFASLKEAEDWLEKQADIAHILIYKEGFEQLGEIGPYQTQRIYLAFPEWFENYHFFNWQELAPIKALYELKRI